MRKKNLLLFFVLTFFSLSACAKTGEEIAKELEISASSKAIKQWERLFKKPERLVKKIPGVDKLTEKELEVFMEYLINHAADSDHPAAAGL